MKAKVRILATAGGLLTAMCVYQPVLAQKPGGILRMPIGNSPASMSIHEEATRIAVTPMMAVFNNLVLFDQHVAQNTFESIRPDLAESWSWDEDRTALTFRLRTGVKWHDGAPFTAKDVKCTWDTLAGRSSEKLRVNPRKSWYRNLTEITVDGDNEVTFHLQRPQPSLLALLASGASPVYPCHVPPAQMRQQPIGTGPFKFVEYKAERIDQGGEEPGLLEAGAALSRRDRIFDHPERVDAAIGVRRGQIRHDVSVRGVDPAAEGGEEPGAASDLRAGAGQRQPHDDRQPRRAALRQSRAAPGDGAEHRSQGLCRYSDRGPRCTRRR